MINIKAHSKGFNIGYVFKLKDKSSYEGRVQIDDATAAIFSANSYYVYLNMNAPANKLPRNLFQSFEKLQIALDYLSCRGIQNSIIKVPLDHFIEWQLQDNGYRIVITENAMSRFTISSGDISNLTVTNYHEGFRFFRFSQISRDLLDSYRNLWLSFECLISTYTPKKKNEPEFKWYCRALNELSEQSSQNDFKELLKLKPAEILIKDLYKDTRCSLFHSKQNENYLVPHQMDYYENVKRSLSHLTVIVLAILEHHHSIRTKSSWVNPSILVDNYRKLFEGLLLYVTDSDNEKELSANEFKKMRENEISNPVSHKIIEKPTYITHRFEGKLLAENTKLTKIRRFSFAKENKELIVFTLDEELNFVGIQSVEMVSELDLGFIEKPRSYDYRI